MSGDNEKRLTESIKSSWAVGIVLRVPNTHVADEVKIAALRCTPPFSFLTFKVGDEVLKSMVQYEFDEGEVVMLKGDSENRCVYILAEGQVILGDLDDPNAALGGHIAAPGIFGEWSPIVKQPRSLDVVAASHIKVFAMEFHAYQKLYKSNAQFRHALVRKIQVKRQVFSGIDGFEEVVHSAHENGLVDLHKVLVAYRKLKPALHTKANSNELDFDAWIYAIKRLPTNVTNTYVFLMCNEIPTIYLNKHIVERSVEGAARRRPCFPLGPGKNLILVREDFTDILDFVSLLCVHCVEAEKLRKRLVKSVSSLNSLMEYVITHDDETPEEQLSLLQKLKFSDAEVTGLRRLWAKDVLHKLWDMIRLHEDYTLRIEWRPHYDTDAQERWTEQIRQAVEQLIGDNWSDYTVDIISSNTHSVVNCLCPVLHRNKEKILEWGKINQPALFGGDFKNQDDLLYALTYHYEKAFPEFAVNRWAELKERGFVRIHFTEFTGIAVDVILLDQLDSNIDQLLSGNGRKLKHFIVNIDYAFGHQAESIASALCLLFGTRIRSFNIIGKAGGLEGARGDIVLASQLVKQRDNLITVIANEGLDATRIQQQSGCPVRTGAVLTVDGTVIQDRNLLLFYKEFFDCISLEMEGSYYARNLLANKELGLVGNVALRFLYYISDLPLHPGSNLSAAMQPWEGIPPLYAVTRAVLEQILKPSN